MSAPNIVDSHRSLTGTCPGCRQHKVLVGCGLCKQFFCYECLKETHIPQCKAANGPRCDFCSSAHRLDPDDTYTLTGKEVADHPDVCAEVLWELLSDQERADFAPMRDELMAHAASFARTQIKSTPNQFVGMTDGTVVPVTLDYDGAMTDWGVCGKAFEAWTRRLAYYQSGAATGAATDAELIERMKDGEPGI